jgi:ketosteroid isomerase-like protein
MLPITTTSWPRFARANWQGLWNTVANDDYAAMTTLWFTISGIAFLGLGLLARRSVITTGEVPAETGWLLLVMGIPISRASLQRHRPPTTDRERAPAPGSPAEDAIVAKFVRAYESADLDALVALLTDDVFMSMPPLPLEYQGRDVVARFCAAVFGVGRRLDFVPTRANGQPAFGTYLRALVHTDRSAFDKCAQRRRGCDADCRLRARPARLVPHWGLSATPSGTRR